MGQTQSALDAVDEAEREAGEQQVSIRTDVHAGQLRSQDEVVLNHHPCRLKVSESRSINM